MKLAGSTRRIFTTVALPIALVTVHTACDEEPTRPGEGLVLVSITLETAVPEADEGRPTIRHTTLALDSLRMTRKTAEGCDPDDDDACALLWGDTIRIELPELGESTTPLTTAAVEDRYTALILHVRGIRIRGHQRGQGFDRSLDLQTTLSLPFPKPLRLAESGTRMANIIISVRVDRILTDPNGVTTDPLTTDDDRLASTIAENLSAALSAAYDDSSSITSNFGLCSGYDLHTPARSQLWLMAERAGEGEVPKEGRMNDVDEGIAP